MNQLNEYIDLEEVTAEESLDDRRDRLNHEEFVSNYQDETFEVKCPYCNEGNCNHYMGEFDQFNHSILKCTPHWDAIISLWRDPSEWNWGLSFYIHKIDHKSQLKTDNYTKCISSLYVEDPVKLENLITGMIK